MLTHILFGHTKEDSKNKEINYIKVLGFNSIGKKYLNIIKKETDIPIITNITKDNYKLQEKDLNKDEIYYLINNMNIKKIKQKPIIKE